MTNLKIMTDLATDFATIAQQSDLMGHDVAWLKTLRLQALTQFNHYGLPTKKEEDWKYSSLWPLSQQVFDHNRSANKVTSEQVEQYSLLKQAYRVVIVDGVFIETLSNTTSLPSGATVLPLSAALEQAQPHLNKQVDIEKAGFNALNTLLMNEGVVITVDSGVKIDKPIELLFINSGETSHLASHLRNMIVLADNSQATVVEHYVSLNDAVSLTNVVTEIVLAEKAHLQHYKLQQESDNAFHISSTAAKQAQDSLWHSSNVSLGAQFARYDGHTELLGEQSHVQIDGLYIVKNDQHIDNHTRIDHRVANTSSEELFKGVMDGNSHAVFNGKVIVHKDAQKTDANQQNHNLLLSRSCEIDTKPEMEIYADDVKCGHGSTVGQLNADQLFFLRARGLDEVTARSLLTHAFAVDVLDRIANKEIRQALSNIIEQRLPKGGAAQ